MTPTEPKEIIVKMPNWLGDAVMATPIIADVSTHSRIFFRISVCWSAGRLINSSLLNTSIDRTCIKCDVLHSAESCALIASHTVLTRLIPVASLVLNSLLIQSIRLRCTSTPWTWK